MTDRILKHILVVVAPAGVAVRSRPAPQSAGAIRLRDVPVGTELECLSLHTVDGVQYARLASSKPEWVRVKERDGSVRYVDVIDLEADDSRSQLAFAINKLAEALLSLRAQ